MPAGRTGSSGEPLAHPRSHVVDVVLGDVEHAGHVEAGMGDARPQHVAMGCLRLLEPGDQTLAVVEQRIELAGGDEERRQIPKVGEQWRRERIALVR